MRGDFMVVSGQGNANPILDETVAHSCLDGYC